MSTAKRFEDFSTDRYNSTTTRLLHDVVNECYEGEILAMLGAQGEELARMQGRAQILYEIKKAIETGVEKGRNGAAVTNPQAVYTKKPSW